MENTLHDLKEQGIEKGKEAWKRLKNTKNTKKVLLIALVGAMTHLGIPQCSSKTDKNPDAIELAFEKNPYRKGDAWFAKAPDKLPRETLAKNVVIIRDQGMCFYIVQKGDNLSTIREKLAKTDEFKYLKDTRYALSDKARNIHSFNVPAMALQSGMFIPIPLATENRETSDAEFYQMSLKAIAEMQEHPDYGATMKTLLKTVSKEKIAQTMCAYARCESAQDWKHFSDKVGSVTLHRREPSAKAFSFSHYHILMEKNADGKTMGPGLKARLKLGLTEGQTYHPKNGGKLFLAYWIEKKKSSLPEIFNMQSENDATKYGKIYNGSGTYGEKLWKNYQYYEKFQNKK